MSFLKYFRGIPVRCSNCSTKFKIIKRKESTFIGPIHFLTKICPRCHNENLYRSRTRGVWERVTSYLGINPYRCSSCYWRFYLLKANLMKRIIKLAIIAIVLVLVGYFTFSTKNDFIALDTKTDPSLSNLTHPEEEELVISKITLEKELPRKNKANTHAKDVDEAPQGNFTTTLKRGEEVPVPPKPKEIIVPKDSFKYVEKEVLDFIEGWKIAWQNSSGEIGDMETYLANYTKDFISDGVPKERWQQKKRKNNRKKQWINIQLSDVLVEKIAENNNQVKVSFMQEYNSSNYSDKSKKILILSRADLNWLISKENTVE